MRVTIGCRVRLKGLPGHEGKIGTVLNSFRSGFTIELDGGGRVFAETRHLKVFSAETEVVTEELRKARASAAEQAASNAHATAEEPESRLEEHDRAGVSSSREIDGWMVAEVTNIGEPDRAQASETAQISRLAEQTAPSELDTTDEALQARLKITRRSLESANQAMLVARRKQEQARVEAAERRAALEVIEREANAVQARVQSERDREKSKRSRRRPEGEIDENGCEWGRALSRASRASSRAAADTPHASKGIAPFGASSSEFISGDHAHAGANFRFVCCTANEGYLGDLSIAPRTPWSEMREQLRKLAGRAVTFVFDEPDTERTCCSPKSDAGSRSQELAVGTAVQWHMCLDLLMLHREHFGLQELEINLVPVDSSPAKPQVEPAEIKNEAPQVVLVRARDRLQTTKVAARDLECKLATGRCAVALALLRLADARLHAADIDLAQQEFRVVEAKLDVSRVESGLFVPGPGESNAGRDARQGRMPQEEKANVEGQVQLALEAAEKELEQEQGLQEMLAAKAERTTHEHAEAESEYRRLREEYYLGLCTQAIQRLRVVGAQSALHAWHENASAQRSQWMRAEKDTVDRAHATEIARMFEAERCESEDGRLAALLQAVKARAAAQMVFAEADAEMTVAGCCPDSAAMHPSSESCLKVTPYRQKLESERCAAEITAAARVAERKARAEAEVAAVHTEAQAGLVRARAACAAVELKIRRHPRTTLGSEALTGVTVAVKASHELGVGGKLKVYVRGLFERVGYTCLIFLQHGRQTLVHELHKAEAEETAPEMWCVTTSLPQKDNQRSLYHLEVSVYEAFPGLNEEEALLARFSRINWNHYHEL